MYHFGRDIFRKRIQVYKDLAERLTKDYLSGYKESLDVSKDMSIPVIHTGSLGLDKALIFGGYYQKSLVEIYGEESTGKTTLAIHAIVEAQHDGKLVAFIDVEHAFNTQYAQALGVDINNLAFVQPNTGDEALEIVIRLLQSHTVSLIIVDSIATLSPKEQDNDSLKKLLRNKFPRIVSLAKDNLHPTTCLFLNQTRMQKDLYGDLTSEPVAYDTINNFMDIVMQLSTTEPVIDNRGEIIGNHTRADIKKDTIGKTYGQFATFDILFGEGISTERELIEWGFQQNLLRQKGRLGIFYGTEKLASNRIALQVLLKRDSKLRVEMTKKLFPIVVKKRKDYYDPMRWLPNDWTMIR